ncbi:hypothetical protein [Streptacidiphilus carbonis]|uniref:hypothetical protein n=1 Tax=Streptacidiphilus carbonis TaxID=105422 RepID=UPI0005AB047B|nr:hypothetical protein [Streptacidiphilus carbonis]
MTEQHRGTGDELWDAFVKEFEKSKGIPEPSAAERAAAGAANDAQSAKRPRRRGLKAVAGLGAVAVLAGAGFWFSPLHRTTTQHASAAPTARPTVTVDAARTTSGTEPMVTTDQAFPAHVAGFTKVTQSGGPDCTSSDTVAPDLIQVINETKGCRGVIGALYKDADDNEYTVVVFALKDPVDAMNVITYLGSNPMSYQVGVLMPPAGSGLRSLPSDSGLVQSFQSLKDLAVVGLAQWSDGRAIDFQSLTDKLQPLITAVTDAAAAHDAG